MSIKHKFSAIYANEVNQLKCWDVLMSSRPESLGAERNNGTFGLSLIQFFSPPLRRGFIKLIVQKAIIKYYHFSFNLLLDPNICRLSSDETLFMITLFALALIDFPIFCFKFSKINFTFINLQWYFSTSSTCYFNNVLWLRCVFVCFGRFSLKRVKWFIKLQVLIFLLFFWFF